MCPVGGGGSRNLIDYKVIGTLSAGNCRRLNEVESTLLKYLLFLSCLFPLCCSPCNLLEMQSLMKYYCIFSGLHGAWINQLTSIKLDSASWRSPTAVVGEEERTESRKGIGRALWTSINIVRDWRNLIWWGFTSSPTPLSCRIFSSERYPFFPTRKIDSQLWPAPAACSSPDKAARFISSFHYSLSYYCLDCCK